ncbi:MAG: hypothetical protein HN348_11035 [Proteobacteria bacterium]|jgi:hypothetical protein|nr:hypothetical protein [Pseudomonadota bacterium]
MRFKPTRLVWVGLLACHVAMAAPSVTAEVTVGAGSLDLDGEGSSGTYIVKVADVTFSTDNPVGCTLTVTSGGITKTGGQDIAYQVTSVEDGAPAPSSGDFTVPSGNEYTYSIESPDTSYRDIYVKYKTQVSQDPGTYNETVYFSVADN